jgi:oxygen-independent coproporphyrinogen-3 oxidase
MPSESSNNNRGNLTASPENAFIQSGSWDEYALALDRAAHDPDLGEALSIYIELPFCPSRCLSCDHITTVTHDSAVIDDYLTGLDQEMTLVTARLGNGRPLRQLHLGGGTPNYLTEPQLMRLMSIVERHFTLTDSTETSLQASPKRTSWSQLELLRGLGFRRIQFEVRDIDPDVQKAVGRSHSMPILRDVFASARDCGFETVSMDLVYGLPKQTADSIDQTLRNIVELAPDRLHSLAYSRRPDTFLHQRSIDPDSMPSLADKLAMFNLMVDVLQDENYEWVGIDCFARQRDELSQAQRDGTLHRNVIGYTPDDYEIVLGFGTAAVSELPDMVIQNHMPIEDWRRALLGDRLPVLHGHALSKTEVSQRRALNDLMCNTKLKDYSAQIFEEGDGLLPQLYREGLVQQDDDGISVTEQGRYALHQRWSDSSPMFRRASAI